jgi:hypothetical protein
MSEPGYTFIPGTGWATRKTSGLPEYLTTLRTLVTEARPRARPATRRPVDRAKAESSSGSGVCGALAKSNVLETDAEMNGTKRIRDATTS